MRTLEEIEADLTRAREELGAVKGTTTEVYSRIVGYYRSVRNWNRGKREEYRERVLYDLDHPSSRILDFGRGSGTARVLLFVRAACPACPAAKEAAGRLPYPVDQVDADTEAGLATAERYQVYSTPTAIFLDSTGRELGRARDAKGIATFAEECPQELAPAVSQ